ncbi:MAG: polysaccharide biosynthesis protein [Ferruginibacter sp.]|nr:polysaccharide biosynthesis protein [Cytophagales bacterium]
MSVIKKLAGETALYGVSSILGRVLNYALVPLHTAIFLPGELAVTVKLFAYVALLNVLYTYGMETAFFRFAAKNGGGGGKEARIHYDLALTSVVVSSLLLSGTLVLFSSDVAAWLDYPGKGLFVRWLAIIVAIDAVVAIPFARLRLEKKARQFATARVINIGLNVLLNVFFLYFCRNVYEGEFGVAWKPFVDAIYSPTLGVGYIFLANLIANAAFFPLLRKQFADFRFRFDWHLLRPMWAYGYPILIMGLAGTVNLMIDRAMLQEWLPTGFYPGRTSEEALGIYGNCYKLSIFMSLVIQAFRYAAEPFFFSRAEDKNAPATFANVMKWFVIACTVIWLGVSVNLDILKQVFLRREIYWEGLGVVPLLLLGNLFLGVYYNLSVWFKLSDKTGYGTLITATGAVVAVVGNGLLIPVMGYLGCAVTFALSCFVMMALCYGLGQQHYPVPYNLKSAAGYVGGAALLIGLANQLAFDNPFVASAFHLLLCGLFGVGIYLLERKKPGPLIRAD